MKTNQQHIQIRFIDFLRTKINWTWVLHLLTVLIPILNIDWLGPWSHLASHDNLFTEGHWLCPGPSQHDFIIQCWTIFPGMAQSPHILPDSAIVSCCDGAARAFGTVQCKHQQANFYEEYAAAAEKMMSRSLCFIWHLRALEANRGMRMGTRSDRTKQREIDWFWQSGKTKLGYYWNWRTQHDGIS